MGAKELTNKRKTVKPRVAGNVRKHDTLLTLHSFAPGFLESRLTKA